MLVTPNADKILNRLWGTNISFSVATTLLSTILIVISILKQRMSHDIPGSDAPRTAIEIIVESSAIYSIASIIWIPLRIIDGPHSPTFLLAFAVSSAFYSWSVVRFIMMPFFLRNFSSGYLQNIAPSLIMLRVAMQRAKIDRSPADLLSSIRFNTNLDTAMASTSSERSRAIPFLPVPDADNDNSFEVDVLDDISRRLRSNSDNNVVMAPMNDDEEKAQYSALCSDP
jgi:hypothetical protein